MSVKDTGGWYLCDVGFSTLPVSLVITTLMSGQAYSRSLRGKVATYEFQASTPKTFETATMNIWLVWLIGVFGPPLRVNWSLRLTCTCVCIANSLKLGKPFLAPITNGTLYTIYWSPGGLSFERSLLSAKSSIVWVRTLALVT